MRERKDPSQLQIGNRAEQTVISEMERIRPSTAGGRVSTADIERRALNAVHTGLESNDWEILRLQIP